MKQIITEDDLETQLMSLTLQQRELERQLSETQLLLDHRADQLLELTEVFREQVRAGVEAINADPETPELAKLQTEFRQKIVDSIVERVDILEDKSVQVHFLFDFRELVPPESSVYFSNQLTSSLVTDPHSIPSDFRVSVTL